MGVLAIAHRKYHCITLVVGLTFLFAACDGGESGGGNAAPVAGDLSVTTDEDTPVSITLSASDTDGDPLTFAVAAGPLDGTVACDGEGTDWEKSG